MEAKSHTVPKNEPASISRKSVDESTAARQRDNARMFDRIAHRYDFLNRLLSLRCDVTWRRRMAECLPAARNLHVLDVATGTADSLVSLAQHCDRIELGVGLDMAERMLRMGQAKLHGAGQSKKLSLVRADGAAMPFEDGSFDAVTIAFGIRNFADTIGGLREFHRVLKPGGRLLVLEFSLPTNSFLRRSYLAYFRYVMPLIGRLLSGDAAAYRYLNRSVENFPYGSEFCELIAAAGFANVHAYPLTLGVATIYQGQKESVSNDSRHSTQAEGSD